MLIDTGGLSNYDIASKKIMPYLEYHGIRKIDIVVITHNDFDHCGALDSLKEQIKINQIVDDCYTKQIDLGKIHLENVNHYFEDSSDDNDKSIVLYSKICSFDFMFCADMPSNIEKQMIQDYTLDVDVLKVGHHGSKYSTCKEFLEAITPRYGIISVGTNRYGHPSKEVLDRLNDIDATIYQTNKDGTIRFKGLIFNQILIETASGRKEKASTK